MKKKTKKRMAAALAGLLFLAALFCAVQVYRAHHVPPLTTDDLAGIDFSAAERLMIVAHPDDETLWGGGHLADGGYLVVCLTNGRNKTRAAEFSAVMQQSGNQGLMLCYPDKTLWVRDNWNSVRDGIAQDVSLLLAADDWELVVTHNPDGEYGHTHHRMTSSLVTGAFLAQPRDESLFYFGSYYTAAALPAHADRLPRLTATALAAKEALLTQYTSQQETVEKLRHMNPFENWTVYQPQEGSTNVQTT